MKNFGKDFTLTHIMFQFKCLPLPLSSIKKQKRNDPREGICPQRGGSLRSYFLFYAGHIKQEHVGGFSFALKPPGKEPRSMPPHIDNDIHDEKND